MKNLIIKNDAKFSDLETNYELIRNASNNCLHLPPKLIDMGVFGVEGLLLLLIATWMRAHEKNSFLITDFSELSEIDVMCDSLYGICALRYANKIFNNADGEFKKEEALKKAYENFIKITKSEFSNAFGNGYLAIPSFRAAGRNSEFKSPFYNGESLVSEEQFQFLLKKAIFSLSQQTGIPINLDEVRLKNIAGVVRELFGNTHKHARTDENGNILLDNFRAVTLNYKEISQERLNFLIRAGGGALSNFGSHWLGKGDISLLDITVVDSGPGYAKRWSKDNWESIDSNHQEKDYILKCFTKHKSTDNKDSSGSGLTNVLKDLKKLKGWFMLRTGSTLVEKSFLWNSEKPEILLTDIKKINGVVEGTSFSIVIPLNDLEETI